MSGWFGGSSVDFDEFLRGYSSYALAGTTPSQNSLGRVIDKEWFKDNNILSLLQAQLQKPSIYQDLLVNNLPPSLYSDVEEEQSVARLESKTRTDDIRTTFIEQFTSEFVNSLVTKTGIKTTDILYKSDSPLKQSFDNMFSAITNKLKSQVSNIPIEDIRGIATQTENRFVLDAKSNLISFVSSSLQTIYDTYQSMITGKTVSTTTWNKVFGSDGVLSRINTSVTEEIINFNNAIVLYLENEIIDNSVAMYRNKQELALEQDIVKIQSNLASKKGLNASSQMYSEVLLRRGLSSAVAEYKSSLQLKLYDFFAQLAMQKENLQTNVYLNLYQQEVANNMREFTNMFNNFLQVFNQSLMRKFTYVDSEIARYSQSQSNLQQLLSPVLNEYNINKLNIETQLRMNSFIVMLQTIQSDKALTEQQTQLLHEIYKVRYLAKFDMSAQRADYKIKNSFYKLDTYNYAFNALASAGGASSSTANPNRPMETVVSTALAGAAAGAPYGPPGIAIGAGLGAIGGVLSQIRF